MSVKSPGELEVYGYYWRHLGPRCQAAGLRVTFFPHKAIGIQFKVNPPEVFREYIVRGLQDGLARRFPEFLSIGGIIITEITVDEVNSSQHAFYVAARMAIEQAFTVHKCRRGVSKSTVSDE